MGEKFKLGEPKIPDVASQGLERDVSTGDRLSGLIIAGNFDAIPDDTDTNEVLAKPEIKDAIKIAIGNACREMSMERLGTILKRCKPSNAEYLEALADIFAGTLTTDAPLGARMLMWVKDYPGTFTPKVLDAANEALLRELNAGRIAVAAEILEALQAASSQQSRDYIHRFSIKDRLKGFFASTDGRAALKAGILKALLSDESVERLSGFMDRAEVVAAHREATKIRMKEFLDHGDLEALLEYARSHEVDRCDVEFMFSQVILQNITTGHIEEAQEIAERVGRDFLPRGFMRSDDVFLAAVDGIASALEKGDLEMAGGIRGQLRVPERFFIASTRRALEHEMANGNYKQVFRILDVMAISDYRVLKIDEKIKPTLLRVLRDGDKEAVRRFNQVFEVPEGVRTEPDVQEAARHMLEGNLAEMGSIQDALRLVEQYKLQKAPVAAATRTLATQLIAREIGSGCFDERETIQAFSDFFDLSQEDLRAAVQDGVYSRLTNDSDSPYIEDIVYGENVIYGFALPEDKVRAIVVQAITYHLHEGNIARAFLIQDKMHIASDALFTVFDEEKRKVALQNILMTGNRSELVIRFLDSFPVTKEVLADATIHRAACTMVEKTISKEFRLTDAMVIAQRFALKEEEISNCAYSALYYLLRTEQGTQASALVKYLRLSKEGAVAALGSTHPALVFFDDSFPLTIRYAADTYSGITPPKRRMRAANKALWFLRERGAWWALRSLKEEGVPPGEFAALLRRKNKERAIIEAYEERLVEQFRFTELDELLTVTGREMPIGTEQSAKVVRNFLKEQMPLAAAQCLKVMEKHGVAVEDAALRTEVERAGDEELRRRRDRWGRETLISADIPQAAHQLAALFYCEVRLLQSANIVLQKIRRDSIDFSFTTHLRLVEIRNDLQRDISAVSRHLRRYLLIAVTSELGHQSILRDSVNNILIPDELGGAEELFQFGTTEEQITYLARAKERFRQDGWENSYGGEKWAVIAEAAIGLIQRPDDEVVIDHIFDLEHNTKAIFDKDATLITQNQSSMVALKANKVLDAKREALGNTRALVRVLRDVLPEDDIFFNRLDRFVDRWVDVLSGIQNSYLARGKEFKVEQYV